MAGSGQVTVRILGDASQLSRTFDTVERDTKTFGQRAGGLLKGIGGAAAAAGIVAFGKASAEAYKESEEAQNRLTQAFKNSPQLIGASIAEFQKLNEQLAAKTKFDDDATASGQAVLAQFGLTADQLKKVTPLLQDYAARTGKDLPTAAQDLGKAILGQGRALKNIGVNFTDAGSAAGNFEQLVGALNSKVGGFAESEGKTAAGQAQILSNQFGELQEKVGAALVPALQKLAEIGLKVVGFFQNLNGPGKAAIGVIAGLAAAAFTITKAVQAWTAVQAALNVVMSANPIVAVGIAVAALVAGVIYAYTHFEGFRKVVDAVGNALKTAFLAVAEFFGSLPGVITGFFSNAVDWLTDAGEKIMDGLAAGVKAAWNVWKTFYIDLPLTILGLLGDVVKWLFEAGKKVVEGMFDGVTAAWDAAKTFWSDLATTVLGLMGEVGTWLLDAGKSVMTGLWDGITEVWNREKAFFSNLASTVLGLLGAVGTWLLDAGRKVLGGLWSGIKEIWEREKAFFSNLGGSVLGLVGDLTGVLLQKGKDLVQGLWDGAKNIWNSFARWWNSLKLGGFTIGGYDIPGPGPNIPSLTVPEFGLPTLPTFHSGGVVPGPPGAEVLAVLQAGETVTPRGGGTDPDDWGRRAARAYAAEMRQIDRAG